MKSRVPGLAIFVFAALFAAGCSKTDSPAPKTAVQAPLAKDIVVSPAETIPDPVTRKGAEAPTPKPGQAGDHSSPGFKGGGAPDPRK